MDFDGDQVDYKLYDSCIGIDYEPTENNKLSLSTGYYVQDKDEGGNESGIVVNGVFEQTFRRGSFYLSGSKGHGDAYFGAENLGLSEFYEFECKGEHNLTRYVLVDLSILYRKDDYVDREPERDDKTKRVKVGITWGCREWLSFRVDYSYNTVDSDMDDEDYRENRMFFTVTLTPPRPYRMTDRL